MFKELFPVLSTLLTIGAWGVDLFYVGTMLFCIYSFYVDGRAVRATLMLSAGLLVGFLIAVNGGHILINLFLSSLAAGLFALGADGGTDEEPSGNRDTSDEETWSEFAVKHIANYMIAREIDKAIDAKNGNDRGGNMHI